MKRDNEKGKVKEKGREEEKKQVNLQLWTLFSCIYMNV